MDVLTLSRLQFALTVMFHYLFPPLTIGMGVVLVYLSWNRWRGGDAAYDAAARFWTRIYALNFSVGVASGIVMEFQFGTNWASYSRFVGDVFGSALAAEGIFAFFLESGFLAVLVFGWNRVSRGTHFLATVMVALGSIFSSIWIVVANCWQQTPAGSKIVPLLRDGGPFVVDGQVQMRAEIDDFWAMVFNPSTIDRLVHVWLGAFVLGGFFTMSIAAWYLLRGRHEGFARRSFRGALVLASVASILLLVSGHEQASLLAEEQPAKLAAMEGHYETGEAGAGLVLFGWPDDEAGRMRGGLVLPGMLSYLVHGDDERPVLGLDAFRPEHRPKSLIPFLSYRLMIGCGLFAIALCLTALWLLRGGRLYRTRWLLRLFVIAVIPAVVGNQAGWAASETGRQPWIVHPRVERGATGEVARDAEGFVAYERVTLPDGGAMIAGLRTDAGLSRAVRSEQVLSSILLFGFIYFLLAAVWIYVLHQKISHGPDDRDAAPMAEARA
ncbi:MAG: cytochrome ubiquinol oxidase subunit I [Planctomycetes bacterium]|nr:cytochrome ubiquinol oxidase subunit I [Planctomycetota bacterium]